MQVWRPPAAAGGAVWWARRLGSIALVTCFPCPAVVPPGLAAGILALAEMSLRLAPGDASLWA